MINPYASPEADCHQAPEVEPDGATRRTVRDGVRRLIGWLLPAAAVNLFWFHWVYSVPDSWNGTGRLYPVALGVIVPLTMGTIFFWLAGPPLVIFLAKRLHGMFGGNTTSTQWLAALATSMATVRRLAPWFAMAWLIAVGELNAYGIAILGPCVCHILAAVWYVPLFRAWLAMRRRSAPE